MPIFHGMINVGVLIIYGKIETTIRPINATCFHPDVVVTISRTQNKYLIIAAIVLQSIQLFIHLISMCHAAIVRFKRAKIDHGNDFFPLAHKIMYG